MLIFNPLQIVMVTCRAKTEVFGKEKEAHDIAVTSWHSPASMEPSSYVVFLSTKLTFPIDIIRKSGVFCVNFIPYQLRSAAVFSARHTGEHLDKFKETELTMSECDKIDCPRISEAVGHLECELLEEKNTGDHVMFIGKVVFSDLKEPDVKRLFQKDENRFTTTRD